tara:strand:- start:140 stop:334 length:195 start_codon:yes stop_codon:yes gene_type:complete
VSETKQITMEKQMKKLNQKIAVQEFYFFCSECEHCNDAFTDPDQIVDGIECESCEHKNYFEENK